jgi:hypothetical protein
MLGVKSNRGTIKGAFADKLREHIASAQSSPQQGKTQDSKAAFLSSF